MEVKMTAAETFSGSGASVTSVQRVWGWIFYSLCSVDKTPLAFVAQNQGFSRNAYHCLSPPSTACGVVVFYLPPTPRTHK